MPELLDRVLAGDEVTITRHGRPVAVVVRPDALRVRRAVAGSSSTEPMPAPTTAVGAGADRFLTNNTRDFPQTITEIEVTYPADLPEPSDGPG